MLVICDYRDKCPNMHCPWRFRRVSCIEMVDANCSTVGRAVNILEVEPHEVFDGERNNPNVTFAKRKNGHGSRDM
jgi:hypothetical protein